ncbi:MAG: glycosyltransferase family 4 protein [Candidatus Paceibacterota bacterium]
MDTNTHNPITVCFFTPNAYPYFNAQTKAALGGAELQIYNFSTALAKDKDFDVHVLVDAAQQDYEVVEDVILHKFKTGGGGIKYLKTLYRALLLFNVFSTINADIYIQRSASYWTGIIALYCKFRNKKFVYMAAHDGDTTKELHPRRTGFLQTKMWWVYEYGLRNADLIVTQNTFQQEELKKNYNRNSVLRQSAHRIPEPHDVNDSNKDLILWVARGEEWKRPNIFLDLAEKHPSEKFVIIMPVSPKLKEFWRTTKYRADNLDNVEFKEFVQPNKIEQYFAKAKVFVNTSTEEGFPNTFIQAAKYKTPIVSLNVDPSSIVQKYKIGIYAEGDENKLTQALDTLLTDKKAWKEHSENAYRYVKDNHDIERIVRQDKKLLRSLCEEN